MTEDKGRPDYPFRFALCNEVLRDLPFDRQCAVAASLGYDGLEVAPFTLADDPRKLTPKEIDRLARTAETEGVAVTGLHWLLVAPPGLSITDPAPDVRRETATVIAALIGLCRDLGGSVLVHGSPDQRRLGGHPEGRRTALDHWAAAGALAADAGITYCIEPLAEGNFIHKVEEAVAVLDEIGSPGLATMLDASAAGAAEDRPVPEVLDRGLADGRIAHVQINAVNRKAPGQGPERLIDLFRVLAKHGYRRTVSVEPFIYEPDGIASAAFSAGYLRGLWEGL